VATIYVLRIDHNLDIRLDYRYIYWYNNIGAKTMTRVKVSPKYQVVIPKEIREKIKLKPGQEIQIIRVGDIIELVPLRSIKEMRGTLKGMNTDVGREKVDRI